MTKTARRKAKRKSAPAKAIAPRATSDRAIYLGILIVGFFGCLLAWLFTDGQYWGYFAVAYVAFVAYLINFSIFHIYRGNQLASWQQSLARLPLRFVGYGTKQGKPLEAAHGHPEVLKTLMTCAVLGLIVVAALGFVAWRMQA